MGRKDEPLYARTNYLINARFLKSVCITEYDIRQANINILKWKHMISDEEYYRLSILPKQDREVTVGKMIQSDKSIYKTIKSGVIKAKELLFAYNKVNDNEVIRIANDAVYIMRNSQLMFNKFDCIEFVPKRQYNLFARLGNLSFFFSSTMGDIDLDIIGLGKEQMLLHGDYMLTFIGNLFYYMETANISVATEYFMTFYNQYINRELPIQYYRELNPDSLYMLKVEGNERTFGMTYYDDDINKLEIGYNASILRELYGCLTEMHQRQI